MLQNHSPLQVHCSQSRFLNKLRLTQHLQDKILFLRAFHHGKVLFDEGKEHLLYFIKAVAVQEFFQRIFSHDEHS